jgi:hypothetical protein
MVRMNDFGLNLLCFISGVLVTLVVEYGLLLARSLYLWARFKRELEEEDDL